MNTDLPPEEGQEPPRLAREAFLNSRNWAILRCAEIMADSGRKDLARQMLTAAKIDRPLLAEIIAHNTKTI